MVNITSKVFESVRQGSLHGWKPLPGDAYWVMPTVAVLAQHIRMPARTHTSHKELCKTSRRECMSSLNGHELA